MTKEMKWNYNIEEAPLDVPIKLLSADDCLLLPQREYIGTITNNGSYLTRGECIVGDPDYFYRSAIIAWKTIKELFYQEGIMKEKTFVTIEGLKQYHQLLMRTLKNPHMIPINICPQCGGIISETDVCEWCGTKLKLVVDNKWEN